MGDVIPKQLIEQVEAQTGDKYFAYGRTWNYANSSMGEQSEIDLLSDPVPSTESGILYIYLLTHAFKFTTPAGETVYLPVNTKISDNFLDFLTPHGEGKWYYKKENEWVEITENTTISDLFESGLVEVKLEQ